MIILPVILESFRSLKDRTFKIIFESQELTPEQLGGMTENLGQFGYLAFKRDPFKQQEKEMLESLESDFEDKKKTPGQRLRGVLYRLWQQSPEGYEDFQYFINTRWKNLSVTLKKS